MESNKEQLLSEILISLNQAVTALPSAEEPHIKEVKIELLTIKESTAEVKGLSEHTLRLLIKNEKMPYIRAGLGKNGKILIKKSDLYNFFNETI